ncbi:MAG TPA: hypothetical protein H9920_05880 [Candidatus Alistipes faecavium]|nr:hypothetical protein [Candidatus Alistipes faecavium]
MKRWTFIAATGLLMWAGSCASLSEAPQQARGKNGWTRWIDERHFQVAEKQQYPATMVRTDGQVVTVMKPVGNLAVVVNPDGSHSTAVIHGGMATIVTP